MNRYVLCDGWTETENALLVCLLFSRIIGWGGRKAGREERRTMVEQTRGGLCQKLRNLQIRHTDHLPEVVGIPGMKKSKLKAYC
jgi:hypothetical protein